MEVRTRANRLFTKIIEINKTVSWLKLTPVLISKIRIETTFITKQLLKSKKKIPLDDDSLIIFESIGKTRNRKERRTSQFPIQDYFELRVKHYANMKSTVHVSIAAINMSKYSPKWNMDSSCIYFKFVNSMVCTNDGMWN